MPIVYYHQVKFYLNQNGRNQQPCMKVRQQGCKVTEYVYQPMSDQASLTLVFLSYLSYNLYLHYLKQFVQVIVSQPFLDRCKKHDLNLQSSPFYSHRDSMEHLHFEKTGGDKTLHPNHQLQHSMTFVTCDTCYLVRRS